MGTRGPSLGLIVALALFAGHSLAAEMTIEQARKFVRLCSVETVEGTLKNVERLNRDLQKLSSQPKSQARATRARELVKSIEDGKRLAKDLKRRQSQAVDNSAEAFNPARRG